MDDRKVVIPLMVRPEDDIQYVEDDNDTVSENEPSTGLKRNSDSGRKIENVYNEAQPKETRKNFLGIPKLPVSRSTSTESSDGALPFLGRSASSRKKHHHDCEKLAVKKSTVERISDGSFFRRRQEMSMETRKGDDEELILEALRHVVRKCTTIDPVKRPCSGDVLNLLSTFNEKS